MYNAFAHFQKGFSSNELGYIYVVSTFIPIKRIKFLKENSFVGAYIICDG